MSYISHNTIGCAKLLGFPAPSWSYIPDVNGKYISVLHISDKEPTKTSEDLGSGT